MLKILAAIALLTSSFSAFAELDVAGAKKALAGQYRFEEGTKSLLFIIRLSGEIEIPKSQDFPYAGGRMTLSFSENENSLSGAPVAHVVIGVGSDEEVTDYHLLLAIESSGEGAIVRLAAKFGTFNDGPNNLSEFDRVGVRLLKYNKASSNYEVVP